MKKKIFSLMLLLIFSIFLKGLKKNEYNKIDILYPKIFLNNENIKEDEIIKKIEDGICFYKQGEKYVLRNYESSIDYKNRTSLKKNYTLLKEYDKNKKLISIKIKYDDIEKEVAIITNKELDVKIIGPDIFKIKTEDKHKFFNLQSSYYIYSIECEKEPFLLNYYFLINKKEVKVKTLDNLEEGIYDILIRGISITGKICEKKIKLEVKDDNLQTRNIKNNLVIDIKTKRPHEEIILVEYKEKLKERKINIKDVYIYKTDYKDYDKTSNTNYLYLEYIDEHDNKFKDVLTIKKQQIKKEEKKDLKVLYLTLFLLGVILLGIGYSYLVKYINKRKTAKQNK